MKPDHKALYKACILVSIVLTFFATACKNESKSEITVLQGSFKQSFTETGTLSAILSAPIIMPRMDYRFGYEFKIIEMIDNGTLVQKGDTLIKLDDAPIQKFILTQKEALEKEKASAQRQAVINQNSLQELQARLRSEEASFDLKKLSMERARFEPKQKQKIKQLEFRQAEIRMAKLKRQLKIKPVMNAYDTRIQEIRVSQKEAELKKAIKALDKMLIMSPKTGLFEIGSNRNHYPPQDLEIGDAVYQGSLIAKIPNVDQMEVNSFVNEADFTKVQVGSQVIIRLDALINVPFNGTITEIARTCVSREKRKVFKVKVVIETSDLRLKPGMTVSCEYICYQGDDEIFVPNECVLKEDGVAFIFLDKGGKTKKVEVLAGRSNSRHTMIRGDVKAGQALIPFKEALTSNSI